MIFCFSPPSLGGLFVKSTCSVLSGLAVVVEVTVDKREYIFFDFLTVTLSYSTFSLFESKMICYLTDCSSYQDSEFFSNFIIGTL
jgi:hypothetical protein